MTMFKRFSCVALGAVVTSLISIVEPAQAFNSSVDGHTAPTQYAGEPSSDAEQIVAVSNSSRSIAQTRLGSPTTGVGDVAVIAGLIIMLLEGLNDSNNKEVANSPIDQPVDQGNPIDPNNPPAEVPTPALLPGLIGMGVAAIRKRRQLEAD